MLYLLATDTCFGLAAPISDPESTQLLYQIKQRPPHKLLAILVPDFERLSTHTSLTPKQIKFLQSSASPFSIITQSSYLDTFFAQIPLFNKTSYTQYSLRVAHTPQQCELLAHTWPLFLTSANLSWSPEIYTLNELEKQFWKYFSNQTIQKIWLTHDLPCVPPSEIFAFKGETLEKIIFRP